MRVEAMLCIDVAFAVILIRATVSMFKEVIDWLSYPKSYKWRGFWEDLFVLIVLIISLAFSLINIIMLIR